MVKEEAVDVHDTHHFASLDHLKLHSMSQQQQQEPSRPDLVLRSFASLLSSALTASGETPESLSESSNILPQFIADTVSDDTACCTVPCLMLKHSESSAVATSNLEEAAAMYLARPLTLTRAELKAAPVALLENLSESFMSLVDSRLRSSVAALLRQNEASALTNLLVGLLSAHSNPISPTAVVTSFRVLPVSDRAQNGDQVAPLVVETVVDLNVLNELVTLTVVAPGTIQGTFSEDALTKVEVVLDTVAFLQSMMKQARFAVRKAVAIASGVASRIIAEQAEASKDGTNGSSNMLPPPPRLPSGQQTSDGSTSNNATWDQGLREDGLSLLTAAAVGLKRPTKDQASTAEPKKSRTADTGLASLLGSSLSQSSLTNGNSTHTSLTNGNSTHTSLDNGNSHTGEVQEV